MKLWIFALIYGLFFINIIDLRINGFSGYHLFLIFLYFLPFIPLKFNNLNWKLFISLGFFVSLLNDLFYGIIGNLFFNTRINLINYFLFRSGFLGFNLEFYFNGGFFIFPVYSILMGISIYFRIIFIFILLKNTEK